MNPSATYTEDTLVQQTTANYLEQKLGWESVYAFNQEISAREASWAGSRTKRWS